MSSFLRHLAAFFIALGPWGLLLLGILDSSFLFMPLGNDLLVVVLTARNHNSMLLYAAMATLGSVIGVLLTDVVSRKGGEAGLNGRVSERRLAYVRRQVTERAWIVLSLAALMPPPFPFTVFIVAAAALSYPRMKLLGIVAVGRAVRFLIEGWLAIHYGRGILQLAQSRPVQIFVFAIVLISIAGSAWSVFSWFRRGRTRKV